MTGQRRRNDVMSGIMSLEWPLDQNGKLAIPNQKVCGQPLRPVRLRMLPCFVGLAKARSGLAFRKKN